MTISQLPSYLAGTPTFEQRFIPDWRMPPLVVDHKDKLMEWINWAWSYIPPITMAEVVVTSCVFAGTLLFLKLLVRKHKGDQMGHWERQRQLQKIISDILTDVVEEARYKDKITRAEKYILYRQMAKFFEQPDLIIQRHPSRKKAEIRQRLGNGVYASKPKLPGSDIVVTKKVIALKPKSKRSGITSMLAASKA